MGLIGKATSAAVGKVGDVTVDRAVDAAAALLNEESRARSLAGFVARRAGLPKGSGAETLAGLLEEAGDRRLDAVIAAYESVPSGAPPGVRLAGLVDGSLEYARGHLGLQRLYYTLAMQPEADVILYGSENLQSRIDRIEQDVVRAFSELGRAEPAADCALFLAALDGIVLHIAMRPDTTPVDDLRNRLLAHFGA
jgi:hypothetical protein